MELKYFATKVKEKSFARLHNPVIFVNWVWMEVPLNELTKESKFLKASRNLKEFPQRKSTISENITGLNWTKKTVDRKKTSSGGRSEQLLNRHTFKSDVGVFQKSVNRFKFFHNLLEIVKFLFWSLQ